MAKANADPESLNPSASVAVSIQICLDHSMGAGHHACSRHPHPDPATVAPREDAVA